MNKIEDAEDMVNPKVGLGDIHEAYKSYMYLEDDQLIDVILAVAVSREQKDEKLWIIIIGASSDGKTELVKVLDDNGKTTKVIKNLTAKTFVNGYVDKSKHPDLAPKLKDKVVLLPEMASILKLHPNEKAAVWAQLRDLYDGVAGKNSGEGVDIIYNDLNVSLIGCSTPAIDNQVLIHQDLGTREMLYRTKPKDSEKLMDKVVENNDNGQKKEKAKKCKELVQKFLEQRKFLNQTIDKQYLDRIKRLAGALTKLRAVADIDFSSGELNNLVYPEEPARVLGQLMVLFKALKSLDDNYSNERAMMIILKVVLSSCSEIRIRILKYLMLHKDEFIGQKKVANSMKIGNRTAYRELNTLYHLGLLLLDESVPDETRPYKTIKKWKVNVEDDTIKFIAEELDVQLVVEEEKIEDEAFDGFTG